MRLYDIYIDGVIVDSLVPIKDMSCYEMYDVREVDFSKFHSKSNHQNVLKDIIKDSRQLLKSYDYIKIYQDSEDGSMKVMYIKDEDYIEFDYGMHLDLNTLIDEVLGICSRSFIPVHSIIISCKKPLGVISFRRFGSSNEFDILVE